MAELNATRGMRPGLVRRVRRLNDDPIANRPPSALVTTGLVVTARSLLVYLTQHMRSPTIAER